MKKELNPRGNGEAMLEKHGLCVELLGGLNTKYLDRLRVTLKLYPKLAINPTQVIRHHVDLYNDDMVGKLVRKTAEKLEIRTDYVREVLAELTTMLEEQRLQMLEKAGNKPLEKRIPTPRGRKAAIEYLSKPNLISRIQEDVGKAGVVGEACNRAIMILVFTSRLRDTPLHVLCLGASGTGKTYLQEKVAELVPDEDKIEFTTLSENAFYYFDREALKHKLLLVEDMEGAEQALYPLRELMSKKRISKSIAVKDSDGNTKSIHLQVEGPVCVAGTTTKEAIYEDNANRSILLHLDGSIKHKAAVMQYQRDLSAGKVKEDQRIKDLFKDISCVLENKPVKNPFASKLSLPGCVLSPLRTNAMYLAFIETITFINQFQRKEKGGFLITEKEDILWANKLLKDVLVAKSDVIPGAVRKFLSRLEWWLEVEAKNTFHQREIVQDFRISTSTFHRYTNYLLEAGLLVILGGNRYRGGYEYRLAEGASACNLGPTIEKELAKIYKSL